MLNVRVRPEETNNPHKIAKVLTLIRTLSIHTPHPYPHAITHKMTTHSRTCGHTIIFKKFSVLHQKVRTSASEELPCPQTVRSGQPSWLRTSLIDSRLSKRNSSCIFTLLDPRISQSQLSILHATHQQGHHEADLRKDILLNN